MRITNATLLRYDVTRENPFSLSNNSALANCATALTKSTCRVNVITSYQDVSRLIERNTNRIDINDLQTLCPLVSLRTLAAIADTQVKSYQRANFAGCFGCVSFGLSQAYMVTSER